MSKILVVDDEEDMRIALMNTLELAGYNVVDAPSGREAFKQIRKEKPDLMLLDMRLPDMDGLQILRKVKQNNPKLPVIMVTGFGSVETAVQTVKFGASDYVSKPFENQDLFQRIEKALSGGPVDAAPAGPITTRLMGDLGVQAKIDQPLPPPTAKPEEPKKDPPAKKKWLKTALAVTAAIILIGGGIGYYLWSRGGEGVYGIPTSHLSGLSANGDRLWLSDWFSQTIYECKLDGDRIIVDRSYHMDAIRPAGLAWSPSGLYVGDAWAQKLSKHALDAGLSEVFSSKSPGTAPAGLFFDGQRLWSTDTSGDKIYLHSPTEGLTVEKDLKGLGTAPIGISVMDGLLWVADADTRRIYQYNVDQDFTPAGALFHPRLQEATNPLSAFMVTKTDAWFGFEGDNKLYRVRRRRLKKNQ